MMKKQTVVRASVVIFVLLLLAGLATGWLARMGLNPIAQRLLHSLARSESAEWRVSATAVQGNLLARVRIDSLRVARRVPGEGEREVLTAASAVVSWDPRELLAGRLHITGVELNKGRIAPAAVTGGASVGAEPPSRAAGEGGLPFVRPLLDRVVLRSYDLIGPGDEENTRLAEFDAELRRIPESGSWDLRLDGGVVRRGETELPLQRSVLRGGIEEGRFRLEELRLETERSHIAAWLSGGTEETGPLQGAVALQPLDLRDLASLGITLPGVGDGRIEGRVAVEGTRDDLLFHGDLAGDAEGMPAVALGLRGSLREGMLALEQLHGTVGEGTVAGSAEFVADASRALSARLDFQDMRLGEVLRAHGLDRTARATGRFTLEDHPGEDGEGRAREVTLRLLGASFGQARFDTLNATLREQNRARSVHFHVANGPDSIGGQVVEDADGVLEGRFGGRLYDAAFLGRIAGRDDVRMHGVLQGVIQGTRAAPRATFDATLAQVRIGGTDSDSARIDASWNGENENDPLRVELTLSGVRLGGAPVDTARVLFAGDFERVVFREASVTRGATRLKGHGELARKGDRTEITLDEVLGNTGLLQWRAEEPVRITLVPGITRVDPFVLDSGEAVFHAAGEVRNDSLDFTLGLDSLELRTLGEIGTLGGRSAGMLSLEAELHGTPAEPEGEASITLDNAVIAGLFLRHVEIATTFADGRARIQRGLVSTVGGDFDLAGSLALGAGDRSDGSPQEPLVITTHDFRISSLHRAVPRLEPVEGRADVTLQLLRWGENPSLVFDGEGRELEIAGEPLGTARFHGSFGDSLLRLDFLEVEGASGRAEATGRMRVAYDTDTGRPVRLPGPYALSVVVPEGRLNAAPLLIENVEFAAGLFEGEILIEGDEKGVHVDGRATAREAELVLSGLKDHYRDIRGEFSIADSVITLEKVNGRQGQEGRVGLTGTAILHGLEVTDYDLVITLAQYEPLFWRDVTGRASGRFTMRPVTLTSGRVVPHMEGDLQVEDLLVRRRLEAQPPGEGAASGPVVPPEVTFAFRVTADNNVRIQNEDVRMELKGEVFTEFDEDGLVLLGEMESIRGQYYLYNNKFNITQGVFTFSDIANLDNVALDVQAETRVQGEKVEVTLTGTLREPDIVTTSESGLSDTDIFRLLTMGYTPQSDQGGSTGFFFETFARAWSEKLGAQIATGIGIDEIGLTSGSNGVESTRLELGKRLTSDAYLNFQYAFRSDPAERPLADWRLQNPERLLSLEYHLTDWFLLDGEAGTLQGNEFLNLDFKFRWSY